MLKYLVVTAVAFLAAALALVQVALGNITDRSVLGSIAVVASFGVILFGAVWLGSWLLRRSWHNPTRADDCQATEDGE